MKKEKLKMSFDPNTIEHLGVKMYSNLPNALAELIANAFDADATQVLVKLIDVKDEKEIHVIDNGVGMNFEDINEKFLRIGRNRRQQGDDESDDGRKVTGRKGLGKLALFGIGERIDIQTRKKGDRLIEFFLDWNEIRGLTDSRDYEPKFEFPETNSLKPHGTAIVLKRLKRKSKFDLSGLAESLSKMFNFHGEEDFEIKVEQDGTTIKVDRKLKYSSIKSQFTWDYSDLAKAVDDDYEFKSKITGKVYSTETPLKPALKGITLYARGRMVNLPEFFGVAESSHGFSYFTGWFDIDFIDDWQEDVISTDRQSLNWDLPRPAALREYLKSLMNEAESQWKKKRSDLRNRAVKQKTQIDVADWYSKLPKKLQGQVQKIINTMDEKSELDLDEFQAVVSTLHQIVPEYPYYHWRHLHAEIQDASEKYYQKQDYYQAFLEAAKRYMSETKSRSKHTGKPDQGMMSAVFGVGKILKVTKKYKKPNGKDFDVATLDNIEEGQKFMSMGVVSGCRNPVSHEEVADLRDSQLFTEKDCLDALALLSHLFRRLEDSK